MMKRFEDLNQLRMAGVSHSSRLWLLAGMLSLCPSNLAAVAPALQIPATGVYLGIRANSALGASQEAAIEVVESPAPVGINRRFSLHLLYYGWKNISQMLDVNGVFSPDVDLAGDIVHRRVPVIAWNCDDSIANSDHAVAGGDAAEDAVIAATAKALAQYPGPVLLRWSWEFNVYWKNQNCRAIDPNVGPTAQVYADFIGTWRRIRTIFQNAGATNVSFVWNPGDYPMDGNPKDPHAFYPGNAYVDWLAIDAYQRGPNESFSTNLDLFYNDFSKPQFGGKPILVGENGTQGFSMHMTELQATYFQVAALQAKKYPLLKGYCYFDSTGQLGDQAPTAAWGGIPVKLLAGQTTILRDFADFPLGELVVSITDRARRPVEHATLRVLDSHVGFLAASGGELYATQTGRSSYLISCKSRH